MMEKRLQNFPQTVSGTLLERKALRKLTFKREGKIKLDNDIQSFKHCSTEREKIPIPLFPIDRLSPHQLKFSMN